MRPATPDEQAERDTLTHAAWGSRLSVERYRARERRLRAHPWSQEAMTGWVLTDSRGAHLSSCETFRMESLLPTGERGVSFGVASVYTEPRLRGRGHALEMMLALPRAIREREPAAQALHLYSDVGEALYARAGYVASPAWTERFEAALESPTEGLHGITEDSLTAEWATFAPAQGGFVIWPSATQLDWHLERERIYAEELGRPRPRYCGARGDRGLILWSADHKEEVLRVLALVGSPGPAELRALLRAAASAARECGLPVVERWLDDEEEQVLGVTELRSGSLPMLAPISEVQPLRWRSRARALWV